MTQIKIKSTIIKDKKNNKFPREIEKQLEIVCDGVVIIVIPKYYHILTTVQFNLFRHRKEFVTEEKTSF